MTKISKMAKDFALLINSSPVFYYGYARYAFMDIVHTLIKNDRNFVLIPNYICQDLIEPISESSLKYVYYEIREDLSINIDDLTSKLNENAKGILVVNYFGMQQNISDLLIVAKKWNICVIEDNSHGLYSRKNGKWLGTFGDVSIFSFRKTLDVLNGAALLINNKYYLESFVYSAPVIVKPPSRVLFKKKMKKILPRSILTPILKYQNNKLTAGNESKIRCKKNDCFYSQDELSQIIVKKLDKAVANSSNRLSDLLRRLGENGNVEILDAYYNPENILSFLPIRFKQAESIINNYYLDRWPDLPSDSSVCDRLKNVYAVYLN